MSHFAQSETAGACKGFGVFGNLYIQDIARCINPFRREKRQVTDTIGHSRQDI